MTPEAIPRPGGRSARIQAAVHTAVQDLLAEGGGDRTGLSIPRIATRAGVTPSTIYRRWGDLPQLLAAIATEQLAPETVDDTGSLAGDLSAWLDLYVEEFSSPLGRQILRDMVADDLATVRYFDILKANLESIRSAAERRGEPAPDVDEIVDVVIAPIIYRILFTDPDPHTLAPERRLERLLTGPLYAKNASRAHEERSGRRS